MNITEEAVEAAANAISECSGMRHDGFWSRVEDLEPEDREYALRAARSALDAAAPHLLRDTRLEVLGELLTDEALERSRKLIEDELVEWRDEGRFMLRNNGLAIRNRDGSGSEIIRFGFELGLRMVINDRMAAVAEGQDPRG